MIDSCVAQAGLSRSGFSVDLVRYIESPQFRQISCVSGRSLLKENARDGHKAGTGLAGWKDRMDPVVVEAVAPSGQISLWHLVMQASLVVKLVMIGLTAASIWSWAIIIEKLLAVRRMNAANDKFEQFFWSGQSLEDLFLSMGNRNNIGLAAIFMAAMREWKRSQEASLRAGFQGVQKRIEKVMDVQIQKEMHDVESRLLFLATTGSAAPFIGLFGTVWGIMISFQAIANSQNTNLAVVAPGIAEALFATAIGLVAAIPATIFYNMYTADAGKIGARLENFADEFSAIISRQLDERV
jgi:biopolymer transport protein TolQ